MAPAQIQFRVQIELMMVGSVDLRHLPKVAALIEAPPGKRDRKRLQRPRREFAPRNAEWPTNPGRRTAHTPSGTSETRCSRTDRWSSASSSSLAASKVPVRGVRASVHQGSSALLPCRHSRKCPAHLLDALDQSVRPGHIIHREIVIERLQVQSRGTSGCSKIAFNSEPK